MSTAAVMEHHNFPVEEEQEQTGNEYAIEESKNSAPSLWRSLLQLKVLLPYLGKILPMLEGNITSALTPAAPRQDPARQDMMRQDMLEVSRSVETVSKGFLEIQTGQREIRTHVQDQSVQLKRIDDQLLRLRESTERNTMEHQELVEDLKSASKLVKTLSTVMIVMMVAVFVMVVFLLTHH